MSVLLDTLARWVDLPSLSGHEFEFTQKLAEEIQGRGFDVALLPVSPKRENLLIRPKGSMQLSRSSSKPKPKKKAKASKEQAKPPGVDPRFPKTLLFCTHLDTVPPHIDAKRTGKRLTGRGSNDAKGSILAQVEAFEALVNEGAEDLGVLLVVGEESDHAGALAAKPACPKLKALVLGEPTRNRFLRAQKGFLKLRLSTQGKAAHSGFPHRGHSAVHELVEELAAILGASFPTDPSFGENLVNIGQIHGGVADNVFAPDAEARLTFRTTMPHRVFLDCLNAWKSPKVRIEKLSATDPTPFRVPPWASPGPVAGFNTDAPYFRGRAKSVYLVGPGDIENAHSDQEFIHQDDLEEAIEILSRLGRETLS